MADAAKWVAPMATDESIMGHALVGDKPGISPELTPYTARQAQSAVERQAPPHYGGALGLAQHVAGDVSSPLGMNLAAIAPLGELGGAAASEGLRDVGAPTWMQDLGGVLGGISGGHLVESGAARLARLVKDNPESIAREMVPDANLNRTGLSELARGDAMGYTPTTTKTGFGKTLKVTTDPHEDWINRMADAGRVTTAAGRTAATDNYPIEVAAEQLTRRTTPGLTPPIDMRNMEMRIGKLASDPQMSNARRALAAYYAMHVTDQPQLWHYAEDASSGLPISGLSRLAKNDLGFNDRQIQVLDDAAKESTERLEEEARIRAAGSTRPTTASSKPTPWGARIGPLFGRLMEHWHNTGMMHNIVGTAMGGGIAGGLMEAGIPGYAAVPSGMLAGRVVGPMLSYGMRGGPEAGANMMRLNMLTGGLSGPNANDWASPFPTFGPPQ